MGEAGAGLRVRLEPAGLELTLRPGERLVDALDERMSGGGDIRALLGALPTVCRAANCGMCLVRPEGDPEHARAAFTPPAASEQKLLTRLGAGPTARLGCQLRAKSATSQVPESLVPESLVVLRLAR